MATGTPFPSRSHADEPADRASETVCLRDGSVVRLRATDQGAGVAAPGERAGVVAADAEGRTVGQASYRRVYGLRGELTLTVEDEFWERGLPEPLIACLCGLAASFGISTLLIRAPSSDLRLLSLLSDRFAAEGWCDGTQVEVEVATAPRVASQNVTS